MQTKPNYAAVYFSRRRDKQLLARSISSLRQVYEPVPCYVAPQYGESTDYIPPSCEILTVSHPHTGRLRGLHVVIGMLDAYQQVAATGVDWILSIDCDIMVSDCFGDRWQKHLRAGTAIVGQGHDFGGGLYGAMGGVNAIASKAIRELPTDAVAKEKMLRNAVAAAWSVPAREWASDEVLSALWQYLFPGKNDYRSDWLSRSLGEVYHFGEFRKRVPCPIIAKLAKLPKLPNRKSADAPWIGILGDVSSFDLMRLRAATDRIVAPLEGCPDQIEKCDYVIDIGSPQKWKKWLAKNRNRLRKN